MSELQFAQQFLTTLDSKSIKYQPDHAFTYSSPAELRIPQLSTDKIKILLNKKVIPSSKKTLADAVMIMGGAPDPPADAPRDIYPAAATEDTTNGSSNDSTKINWQDQLSEPVFWDDLQVFLQKRLQDREGGKKLRAIIEKAWRADVVRIAT
ncbi:hypothetical protein DV735_g1456, partial [Chaetothyriales sp. CBS 134920]